MTNSNFLQQKTARATTPDWRCHLPRNDASILPAEPVGQKPWNTFSNVKERRTMPMGLMYGIFAFIYSSCFLFVNGPCIKTYLEVMIEIVCMNCIWIVQIIYHICTKLWIWKQWCHQPMPIPKYLTWGRLPPHIYSVHCTCFVCERAAPEKNKWCLCGWRRLTSIWFTQTLEICQEPSKNKSSDLLSEAWVCLFDVWKKCDLPNGGEWWWFTHSTK